MTNSQPPTQVKDDIKRAYDAIAPKYLTWTESTHKTRLAYLERLLHNMNVDSSQSHSSSTPASSSPKPCNILELGCGAGIPTTQYLSTIPNTSITANDISSTQIALARERLSPAVTLIQGDMMELKFREAGFDVVVAMYSIFHLPREEQEIMMARIYGWLTDGGWVLVNFAAGEFERVSDEKWLGGQEGVVHWSGWGVEGTRRMVKDVGFEIVVDEVVEDEEEEVDGSVKRVGFHWVMARK